MEGFAGFVGESHSFAMLNMILNSFFFLKLNQVKDESKRTINVAKLFPEKNRSNDCVPYDQARVLLPTTTDDYINAAFVRVSKFFFFEFYFLLLLI